ncbi:Clavaminate synthase 2 (Clavaminic acid synthetase 2) (CAS2) (CS2) [Actinokineospora spheciospongiae]|uniref:Clavaminate synthase 2 (Clavaminic acid synthetase 2) (CAS2) (CS2) n=1 Tax=Actinokineospora spheciospongiae TaxID=909613 RepID=W7IU69_9PSEU|nr:clavaminate synthase Cs1 [Actinokineospora spheciospongiae]EWC64475.1 Clavaminate synthase 2 (Clavaminic acid synthetase 2) (CAS2) (CS2) [Actinokineospora spheciospongiae]
MSASTIDCSPFREELAELASALPGVPRADLDVFFQESVRLAERLPSELRDRVDEFNDNGNVDGYLLLRGLPVEPDEDLPATPTASPPPQDRPLLSMEAMLCLIGSQLGLLTAYDQGYGNRRSITVLHELYPTPEAHHLSGGTSTIQLEFHTDLSHHAHQPNYILLSCSRGDHEGKAATLVGSIRKALPLLSPEVRSHLFDRVFTRQFDAADPGATANVKPLYGDPDDPFVSFNRSFLTAETEEDVAALDALSAALTAVTEPVLLTRGDLLVIDNFRIAHGRAPFSARWDGRDRWLHRAYVRTKRNGQFEGGERPGAIIPFIPRR